MTEDKQRESRKKLLDFIESFEEELAKVYPLKNVKETIKSVQSVIKSDPSFLKCVPYSIIDCVKILLSTGINVDPFYQYAYLSVIYDKKQDAHVCKLNAMQKGLFFIAYQSGLINHISTNVVKENDVFEYSGGTEENIVHKISLKQTRGKTIGAYCVISFKNGHKSYAVMGLEEIQLCRKNSKSSAVWEAHFDEMCKKTVGKRATKNLNYAPMQLFVSADDESEYGPYDNGQSENYQKVKVKSKKDAILSACSRYSEEKECSAEDGAQVQDELPDLPF